MPIRAALDVIRRRDQIRDLDEALAFLGLASLAARDVVFLEEDDEPEEPEDEVEPVDDLAALEELLAEPDADDLDPRHDAVSRRRAQDAAARRRRSMIAYMLVPDGASSDEDSPQPTLEYTSVPRRRIPGPSAPAPLAADAWSVARAAHDLLRAQRPGRIDIEACVVLAARREAITFLPRVNRRFPGPQLDILVDTALACGPLGPDVDALRRALGGVARDVRVVHVRWTGDRWLGGTGPIWTFAPLEQVRQAATPVVITGAHLADIDPTGLRWDELARALTPGRPAVVVSVGSSQLPWAAAPAGLSWLPYEGR